MARLVDIELAAPPSRHKMPLIDQEQEVVIQDLIASADIAIKDYEGPFTLSLDVEGLVIRFEFTCTTGGGKCHLDLPAGDFKKIVKDYTMMVEAYESARSELTPDRLEAIDMGRRGLHNEGAEMVVDALMPQVEIDNDTARRLFTLISIVLIGHNAF